jgi:uncharacterized protein (TIGR02145 family)
MNSLKYLFTLLFLFLSMYGFSSDSLKITDIEKNDYDVVVIGKQVWMQENLRTSTYRNGDSILHAPNNADWGGLQKGAWCMVENSNSQCEIYGKLYNHYAVSDPRGICPKGWKVPSLEDFNVLAQFLGGEAVAGGKLKDVGTTCWQTPNLGATNESGFSGLPGGQRSAVGKFGNIGNIGTWWTNTKNQNNTAWSISLFAYTGGNALYIYYNEFRNGLSVRCIKD